MDDTAMSILGNRESNGYKQDVKLPPELSITWCNLSVWVKKKLPGPLWKKTEYENQRILNNVNGVVKSGTLMAIMGASGSGKTTLLATLSQRMKVGETEGDILVNGCSISKSLMNKMSGFVPQNDMSVETLTVIEHMLFMSRLKMDRRELPSNRYQRINGLLQELGLRKCRDTRLSSLSGGERKRVSLAVQLLTDPSLLFCDEPTTGLDSYNANAVIEKLRLFASRGKAVICTIHQPTSGIFDMFDRVLLIADGRVAFQGDVRGAEDHFNGLGLICPATYNKAEFYVQQLGLSPGKEDEGLKKIKRLCDSFELSIYGQLLTEELTRCKGRRGSILVEPNSYTEKADLDSHYFKKFTTTRKVKAHVQLYWLIWRSTTDVIRQYPSHIMKLTAYWIVAILLSIPYADRKLDQNGVQNLQGFLNLMVTEVIFTNCYAVINHFPNELPIFLREIGNDLYSPGAYYISQVIVLMPQAMISSFVFTLIMFNIAGLYGGIFGFFLVVFLTTVCACSANAYGCAISALFESMPVATLLSVPLDFIFLVFSGLFLQISTLPPYLSWLPYVSQFFYGCEAVSITQWSQIDHIDCSQDVSRPCIPNGEEVLIKYGYNVNDLYFDLFGLFMIYSVCHILGFLFLWRRSKKQPVY